MLGRALICTIIIASSVGGALGGPQAVYEIINVCEDAPDPANVAAMARFIVHQASWTAVSYISHSNETKGWPLSALYSVSDGPEEHGSGVPYFYVSRLQDSVTDLMDNSPRCSLIMSLAQGNLCKVKNWDPEDPRCAHVVLSGTFQKINDSVERDAAEAALFTRHPSFVNLPESHHFFFSKLNIERIVVQDTFGGPSVVPVSQYFRANDFINCIAFRAFAASGSGAAPVAPLLINLISGLTIASLK